IACARGSWRWVGLLVALASSLHLSGVARGKTRGTSSVVASPRLRPHGPATAMRSHALVLLLLAPAPGLVGQEPAAAAPFRFVPVQRTTEPTGGPAWAASFDAATAAAKERHVCLLLYFTAKW